MAELAVLQAIRLKGRADAASVARSTGFAAADAQAALDALSAAGLVEGGSAVRITPAGIERLGALAAIERAMVDQAALRAAYDDFHHLNDRCKAVVTSWQMKAADVPNDHTDAEYDEAVIARLLDKVDARFRSLLERMIAIVPRLAVYRVRFDAAVEALHVGDHAYVASPMIDSYHTVWFELHEELIGLLGRNRADEAAAGRAL